MKVKIILLMLSGLLMFHYSPVEATTSYQKAKKSKKQKSTKQRVRLKEVINKKSDKKRAVSENGKVYSFSEQVSYEYNFENDDRNFTGDISYVEGKTKDWVVLINFHTNMPLNLSPEYKPGTRTMAWGIPFELALSSLFRVSDYHRELALLRSWTSKHRDYVTFMLVPPGTDVTFKYGLAAGQEIKGDGDYLEDQESGGGMQFRLRYVPKGAIAVTMKSYKQDVSKSRKDKKVYLPDVYKAGLDILEKKVDLLKDAKLKQELIDKIKSSNVIISDWLEEYIHITNGKGK